MHPAHSPSRTARAQVFRDAFGILGGAPDSAKRGGGLDSARMQVGWGLSVSQVVSLEVSFCIHLAEGSPV